MTRRGYVVRLVVDGAIILAGAAIFMRGHRTYGLIVFSMGLFTSARTIWFVEWPPK